MFDQGVLSHTAFEMSVKSGSGEQLHEENLIPSICKCPFSLASSNTSYYH